MTGLNHAAEEIAGALQADAETHRIETSTVGAATVLDLGVHVPGGLVAGEMLADACMGGDADIFCSAEPGTIGTGIMVKVATDNPLWSCLGCQYAGWPLSVEDYFAMVSGPIRLLRGKEAMLESLSLREQSDVGVAILESDSIPNEAAIKALSEEANLPAEQLVVLVAPTTSIAGNIQVVARCIETAMHKFHELQFDMTSVLSAVGSAPLPPPARKSIEGIGRTNDAILYGGTVTLFVDCEQQLIDEIGPRVPSNASRDFGRPFGEVFASYEYDFYKVDPQLFSPAVVTIVNMRSGTSSQFGERRDDILRASFS